MKVNSITIEFTRDTPESRDKLVYGDAYLVKYYDDKQTKKEIYAVGAWSGGKFTYPFMKIRQPPTMDMVMGWFAVKEIK